MYNLSFGKEKITRVEADVLYCKEMLPKVSRTFAPTIRLLPQILEVPVTVAYLLCRIADTVEDSPDLNYEKKRQLLTGYARIFTENRPLSQEAFMKGVAVLPRKSADDELVYHLPRVLNVFRSFSLTVQKHISRWVVEMSLGMQKYAQEAKRPRFTFLKSMKELDEYTYYVAGTVGYLLTELFSYYSHKITPPLKKKMENLAGSFGKGLQLVNIIRDMTTDLRRGQSYIPDELLEKYRLSRDSIFDRENADKAEELFNELIQNAVHHLDNAMNYILLIPKEESQIRMFCILPVFWAMRTLEKIQQNTLALLGSEKIKISRSIIRREYFLAMVGIRSNRLMRRHYLRIRQEFNNLALDTVRI